MKKLILAFVALAFAFAISSCCDQSYCPGNSKCSKEEQNEKRHDRRFHRGQEETPYRWDQPQSTGQDQERQHRRW